MRAILKVAIRSLLFFCTEYSLETIAFVKG